MATGPQVVDNITATKVATLNKPLAFALRPNEPGAVYIAEKPGTVRRVRVNGATVLVEAKVLDITKQVSTGDEQGLLGIAFSPDGSKLYADYTNTTGDTRVVEYPFSDAGANQSAARVVLAVPQPYEGHNAGNLVFGPDKMLYIALGDGGQDKAGHGDPQGNGQNLNTPLGKILRINPAATANAAYSVPADNPFVGQANKRGEIWHYGLRNPFRFSFDSANGDMWIGDVGQDTWEEVDHVGPGAKGVNFGWSKREGKHDFNGGAMPPGAVDPVFEMSHKDGYCAVAGGYVYRGTAIRGLQGTYVFGDLCKGVLMGLSGTTMRTLGVNIHDVVSFGQDQSNELWVLSIDGPVYRLNPA